MQRLMVSLLAWGGLMLLALPASVAALEVEVPGLLGAHGCTNLAVDVDLAAVEGVPERVVLRLEVEHAPGIHLSCVSDPYQAGATFYSLVEVVDGMRTDASGSLPAEAATFMIELEFEHHLWNFDLQTVPLELWLCEHPDFTPVLCDGWGECPVTEITAATLVIEPAVATDATTWSGIRSIFHR